jgi:uncharacterized protein YjbI with pentapeptide repeats
MLFTRLNKPRLSPLLARLCAHDVAPIGLLLLFSLPVRPDNLMFGAHFQSTPTFRTDATKTYFYEQDFRSDPTLAALPNQVVVLTLHSNLGTGSPEQHFVRYQLASGNYKLCLGGAPLTQMTFFNQANKPVATIAANSCSRISLTADSYSIFIFDDRTKVTGQARTVFVQLPAPHVKTINADGTPKSGYWALQPDPAQDPTGAGRAGRLHALPQQKISPPNDNNDYKVYGMPLAPDWTSSSFDDTALIRLDTPELYSGTPLNFYPVPTEQDQNFNAILFGNGSGSPSYNFLDKIAIDDRADGTIRLGATSQTVIPALPSFFHTSPRWAIVGATSFLTFPPFLTLNPPPPSMLARLQFRFFPESKGLSAPPLEEGEVGFFQSCGYGGNAAVFSRDIANLTTLSSPVTTINHVAAVKLGPNTEVIFYAEPGFAGTSEVIQSDTDCLDSSSFGTSVGSFQVRPSTVQLSVSPDCLSCQLPKVDLSNSLLDGASLSGTDLSDANLTAVSFAGAALDDVNLSHATINGAHLDSANMTGTSWFGVDFKTAASFTKLTLDRASGLAGANLEGVDLTGASLQEIDFNFTDLTNAKLPQANLTGAILEVSKLNGTDLTKAILHKADLAFTHLTKTKFPGADLTSAYLGAVTTDGVDFTGAHFDHSELAFADFTGGNLTGATFPGADLGFAAYTLNQLRVANLQGAVFDGQTFYGSDLHGIDFSGASMKKTVFKDVTVGPTKFVGADLTGANFQQESRTINLSGANFNGATLTKASLGVTFGSSTFIGAKLPGAQLVSADLTGADLTNADLTGANLKGAIFTNPLSLKDAVFNGATGLVNGDLSRAALMGVIMQNTDLSGARLYGAQFDNANLDGSNLSGAFLTNNPSAGIVKAASLTGAHLKNVNLSNAKLSGANFTNASFYGTVPAGQNTCQVNQQGFTQSCATAAGATMNNTQFSGAYLYGVDFTSATVQGVQFGNSVLIGANFTRANLSPDPSIGTESGFTSAFLQGVNLASATLNGTSLSGAFLDFRPHGNDLYLKLDGTHTVFPLWKTQGQAVCIFAYYSNPTTVPIKNTTLTCPDGSSAGVKGCGPTVEGNTRWASSTLISQTNPPASYLQDATYTKAAPAVCSPSDPW